MFLFHIYKLIAYDIFNIWCHGYHAIRSIGFQIIGKYEFGFFLLVIRINSFYCCANIKEMSFKVYIFLKNCNFFLSDTGCSQELKDILKVTRKIRKKNHVFIDCNGVLMLFPPLFSGKEIHGLMFTGILTSLFIQHQDRRLSNACVMFLSVLGE